MRSAHVEVLDRRAARALERAEAWASVAILRHASEGDRAAAVAMRDRHLLEAQVADQLREARP